jgi:hypothetical protein
MDSPWNGQTADDNHGDQPALLLLELSPDERVIWSGRPRLVRRLVLQSVPKALIGLAFIAFTLFWMIAVISGGHNNWDKGQVVPPFAPHNVLIAAIAGLWMIPPGLYLLFWPLRSWRRLRRNCYALTDRRAVIVTPGFLDRSRTKSFTAEALPLMRFEEHPDGTGDLIFARPSNWAGLSEAVGFLGIDKAWDIEGLVRKTLITSAQRKTDSSAPFAVKKAPFPTVRKCYRLPLWIRLFQFVFLAAGALVAVCILADLVLVCAVLVVGPARLLGPRPPGLGALRGAEIAAAIAAGLGSLLMGGFVCAMFFHFALRIPIEITIDEERDVRFRGRLRTVTIPVSEIVMIRTGEWFDPNRFQAVVRHKRGKLTLINHFSNFTDFLATVKGLNPAIQINGF